MALDKELWPAAWARFQSYAMNLPIEFDEDRIKYYHGLVLDLEKATAKSLQQFKIQDQEMKRKVTGSLPPPLDALLPRSVQYSNKKYCDAELARHQIRSLLQFLKQIEAEWAIPPSNDRDYWSMTDSELEKLAHKYKIPAWGRSGEQGEHWSVDRTFIIDQLVKRDLTIGPVNREGSTAINIGTMIASSVQQESPGAVSMVGADFQPNDPTVGKLAGQIKDLLETIQLSPIAKEELRSDVSTIEAQLASPHPKMAIIIECLRSARSILEGATGSMIAPAIVCNISKYIG
jgi:hypothetical protein